MAAGEAREALNDRLQASSWSNPERVRASVAYQLREHPSVKAANLDEAVLCDKTNGNVQQWPKLVDRVGDEMVELIEDMQSAGGVFDTYLKGNQRSRDAWKMVEHGDLHRVLVRKDPSGGPVDSLCVEGIFDGPIDAVLAMARDVPFFKEWFPRVTIPTFYVEEAICQKQVGDGFDLGLLTFKAPWPMPFHELASAFFSVYDADTGVAVTTMRTLPDDPKVTDYERDGYHGTDLPPQRKGAIRTRVNGGFVLMDLGDGRCMFRGIFVLDINIPAFFLNLITQKLGGALYTLFCTEIDTVLRGNDKAKKERFEKVLESADLYRRVRAGKAELVARKKKALACEEEGGSEMGVSGEDSPMKPGTPDVSEGDVFALCMERMASMDGGGRGVDVSSESSTEEDEDDEEERNTTHSDVEGYAGGIEQAAGVRNFHTESSTSESTSACTSECTSASASPMSVLDIVPRSPDVALRSGKGEKKRKGWRQAFGLRRSGKSGMGGGGCVGNVTVLSPIVSEEAMSPPDAAAAAVALVAAADAALDSNHNTAGAAAATATLRTKPNPSPILSRSTTPPSASGPAAATAAATAAVPAAVAAAGAHPSTPSPLINSPRTRLPLSVRASTSPSNSSQGLSVSGPLSTSVSPYPPVPSSVSSSDLRDRDPALFHAISTLDRAIVLLQSARSATPPFPATSSPHTDKAMSLLTSNPSFANYHLNNSFTSGSGPLLAVPRVQQSSSVSSLSPWGQTCREISFSGSLSAVDMQGSLAVTTADMMPHVQSVPVLASAAAAAPPGQRCISATAGNTSTSSSSNNRAGGRFSLGSLSALARAITSRHPGSCQEASGGREMGEGEQLVGDSAACGVGNKQQQQLQALHERQEMQQRRLRERQEQQQRRLQEKQERQQAKMMARRMKSTCSSSEQDGRVAMVQVQA